MKMVKERHPTIANELMVGIDREEGPCFQSVRTCQRLLVDAGFIVPPWPELVDTLPRAELDPEPNQPKFGWQQKAARQLHEHRREVVQRTLTDPERAMLRSQRGPLASAVFTAHASDSQSPSPLARADVAANLTLLATIALRAPEREFWAGGGSPLRLLHRYVEKQERGCPRTSSFAIWTSVSSTDQMADAWQSLRMGSRCGEEHNLRST